MNIVTQECVPTFLASASSDPSSSESIFKYSGAWFCLQRKTADGTHEDASEQISTHLTKETESRGIYN
jgi:exo-beta-1,3-glucanase (GH17 family)